ncbi:MAG: peptidase S24, partial [Muribaculaceae bacterium]|nr:peptidase S24 [Muribaculaceae bacterium]
MVTRETHVEIHLPDTSSQMPLPFAEGGIRAGFPSPAQDYISESIDLNTELIAHPAATFYGRVIGDSMSGEGIEEGDILVIDKSLEPTNGDLAVCQVDGEFTLK